MNGTYSDSELEELMADVESELVERKESLRGDAPTRIREAVCSFANDLPDHRQAGVVFVGVRDDGTPGGLSITEQLLAQLADVKADGNIVPPPTLSVRRAVLAGQAVAVMIVEPSTAPPVRFRGQVWIRIGPRRAVASPQDERILNEKRRSLDVHFDALPIPTAKIDDLDLSRFDAEYLPRAVSREALAANDRTVVQRLAALKMVAGVDDPIPTVTGLLVLGKHPQDFLPAAYVQFLRLGGREWGDPVVDEARCDGAIADQIRRLDEKLEGHNRTAVDFTSDRVESRRATYPIEALQQLTRNAVMHRAYEGADTYVMVYWFDDRVEIVSPGAPYGGITAETLGAPGLAAYRNPNLAEAMKVLGLAQRFGLGIATARSELEVNGQPPPEFRVDTDRVFCTVRARS